MADDDDDLTLNDEGQGSTDGNGPSVLRKQNSKLSKENDELKARLEQLEKTNRQRDIAQYLTEHKASAKLAKFVDFTGDVTSESVRAWLEAEGDALGWVPETTRTPEEEATAATASRISQTVSSAPESSPQETWDVRRIADHSRTSDEDLIKAGIIPDRPSGLTRRRR